MKKLLFFFSILLLAIPCQARIIYVDVNTPNDNDGSDWANAYAELPDALTDANSNTDVNNIWVASGTYYPTSDYGLGIGDRGRHFRMINGVTIYGGFEGNEPNTFDVNDRDLVANETILSGDIGIIGDNIDNCYHVFYHPDDGTNPNNTAILDGVTISGGKADGSYSDGGGMYNISSSPMLINCIFNGNSASDDGGGMKNYYSSPRLTNCMFSSNLANDVGGGIYNWYSNPVLINCTFSGNLATGDWSAGGGIYNHQSSPTVTGEQHSK